ncbi:PAS domain-containing protein, partial [Methylocystis sp. 9N]
MAGSQLDLEEGARAAARIAADPAFAALDASGAPILATRGDPLAIVYLNDAARAVFGEDAATLADQLFRGADPGAKRLAELVESVRQGAALRLERLSFPILERPQTVTFLCRSLGDDHGDACFILAALGVRPQSRAEAPVVAARAPEESASEATLALRARLAARHGARAPRFLWKTDAQGRFVDVTYMLADVVGDSGADILGRSVEEVAQTLSLGPALALAAASRRSWSGLEVGWPLEGGAGRVPATLGALPMLDAARHFTGFQGYGVLHLDRAVARESGAPTEARKPSPAPEETGENRIADNIVVLRPPPPAARGESEGETALSSIELSAFDEIARTLREGGPVGAEAEPAREEAAPAAPLYSSQALLATLDHLPVGVLVARGKETLYVNRALLDDLGYADRAAFDADGGFARMFFGRTPGQIGAEDGAALVSAAGDGGALDLDAHLQSVEWDGGPATLVVLRRHPPRRP